MVNKAFGYLGIAARARKIAIGETAYHAIVSKKAKLVFLANDASERTSSKIQHVCNSCAVECITSFSSEEISSAIGQFNRMTVAVLDQGLAEQIKNCLK